MPALTFVPPLGLAELIFIKDIFTGKVPALPVVVTDHSFQTTPVTSQFTILDINPHVMGHDDIAVGEFQQMCMMPASIIQQLNWRPGGSIVLGYRYPCAFQTIIAWDIKVSRRHVSAESRHQPSIG